MKVDSIVDRACQNIQEWIVTGRFKPGEQIKEENISQRLEISRPPVREALKMLEATGLVVRKPRRGVFVPLLTRKDVWEIYTLKAALYELVTELAMDMMTDAQVRELESLVAEMERIVSEDPVDILLYQKHHKGFHSRLMGIAGNGRLNAFAANLHNQVTPFSYKSLQQKEHLLASVRYHREIIEAIKKGDRASACRLMKRHVLDALLVFRDMQDAVWDEVLPSSMVMEG
jgi:DNA-binding GntR family transcriptional regulator